MSEPKTGDRVRVTYEAIWDQDRGSHCWLRDLADGTTTSVPSAATVEVIEPADDPSTDPIGTVRNSAPDRNGGNWLKRETRIGMGEWLYLSGHFGQSSHLLADYQVGGWAIIGAVPNTPAWDAWQKGELRGAPEFPGAKRALWTGDGSEEPPAHVNKVVDGQGDALTRTSSGWIGDGGPSWEARPKPWSNRGRLTSLGWTEVVDE